MSLVFIYIAAVVAANLLVATFGPWFSPINSFALIGLDMVLRDHLHDRWTGKGLWPRMLALIAGAGVISYLLNPVAGTIAVASTIAFTAAGAVNAVVYHLGRRFHWLKRSNGSNAIAAGVDSVLFPTLAFGVLMPGVVMAQFAAKMLGGLLWSLVFWRTRAAKGAV